MSESPTVPGPSPGRADRIFEGYLLEHEAGTASAFEELVETHPEHAEELRRLHEDWKFGRELLGEMGPPSVVEDVLEHLRRRQPSADEKYRTLGEIAHGGMGSIHLVWDKDLQRHLAKKTIRSRPDVPKIHQSRAIARLLEEAHINGQLDHPGIVPIHELGLDSDGRVFFTMKLVRGRDLSRVLELVREEKESWTVTRALGVLLRVTEAMAYAHEKGVIHRDLKPANIMVGRFGEVFVMDWGVARLANREDEEEPRVDEADFSTRSLPVPDGETPRTPWLSMQHGEIVGTPSYMAPEQALGDASAIGPAADVYAVGAILYRLLAGHAPFEGSNANEALVRAQFGKVESLAELNQPAELISICEKAMARDPADRYPSMQALGEDLRAYLEVRVVRAHRTGALAELRKWILRNKVVASLAALFLVAAIGVVALATYVASTRDEVLAAESAVHRQRVEASLERAFYRLGERDPQEALADFEAALELEPTSPEALAGFALTHVRLKRLEEALQLLEKRPDSLRRHSGLQRVRLEALLRLGRLDEARRVDADLPEPQSPLDHYLLGVLEFSRGHEGDEDAFLRAEEGFSNASLMSSTARALYEFEWAHALGHANFLRRERGDPFDSSVSRRLAHSLSHRWPDSISSFEMGGFLLQSSGLAEEAIEVLQEGLAAHPDILPRTAHLSLAGAYKDSGQSARAEETLREALAKRPRWRTGWFRLGELLFAERRLEEAYEIHRELIARFPEYSFYLNGAARALMELERFEEALPLLRASVRAEHPTPNAYFSLARCLANLGEGNEAIPIYQWFLRLRPREPAAHRNLAALLGEEGRVDESLVHARRAVELKASDARCHSVLGQALVRAKDPRGAEVSFRKALRLDPEYFHALSNLAIALMHEGRAQESEPLVQKAVAVDGDRPEARNLLLQLATLQIKEGELKKAEGHLRELVDRAPESCSGHAGLGWVLRREGRHEEAIPHFREALRIDPASDPNLWRRLGLSLKDVLLLDEAVAAYRRSIELDADRREIWTNLAYALQLKHAFDESEKAARRAIAIDESYWIGWWSLGVTLRDMGKFEEAIDALRKADDLLTDDNRKKQVASMLRECRDSLEMLPRIEAAIADPASIPEAELSAWVSLCRRTGRPGAAADLLERGLNEGTMDSSALFTLACERARDPEGGESSKQRAIEALTELFDAYEQEWAQGTLGSRTLLWRLRRWKASEDLHPLREEPLWERVEDLMLRLVE